MEENIKISKQRKVRLLKLLFKRVLHIKSDKVKVCCLFRALLVKLGAFCGHQNITGVQVFFTSRAQLTVNQ